MKGGYKYTKKRNCRSPQLIGLKRSDAKTSQNTRTCKPTRKKTKTKAKAKARTKANAKAKAKAKTKKRHSKNKNSKNKKKRKSPWYKRN